MKPRTKTLLIDEIDRQLIWRKKELTQFKFLMDAAKHRADQKAVVLRSAVTLLYAHWEGFIKASGMAYLQYIGSLRLRYEQLDAPFLALALRKILGSATGSKRIDLHIEATRFFLYQLHDVCTIAHRDSVSTKSNLTSDVLRDIVVSLGLDYSPFQPKAHLIDEGLVKARNEIAHGEYLLIDEDRFAEVRDGMLSLMEIFRTQIQNAAVTDNYLITRP